MGQIELLTAVHAFVNLVSMSFSVDSTLGLPSWLELENTPTASLQSSKIPPPNNNNNKCPGYDTKQSDGEVPVMLEHLGMQGTPSLPFLPCPLWLGVVASDSVLSMGQIELNSVHMLH